ncbi:MAG: methyltransferase domain-containing protein [Selenomonadaceae bacterium]|nr:methyltransferase domain-containing protein [Selenomonadaceae bacterium]
MAYPELNRFGDKILFEHYKRYAVEQGHSTCIYDRREYLQKLLQDTIDNNHLKTLEISPWDSPFLRGDNVKYFETMNAEDLRKATIGFGRNLNTLPQKIDFIEENGDLSVINETFDIVFTSHVIEHCPDLIEHFRSVSRILNAGGVYVLIIPDKRYCFDYYHAESTISEVIEAFAAKRKIPRLADVINLAYTRTHNNAILHWLGYHGERYGYQRNPPAEGDAKAEIMGEYFHDDGRGANLQELSRLVSKYSEALDNGKYISTHNWRFTPDSFGYIVDMLNKLGLIMLSRYRLCHTIWGRQEFIAMLEKI